MAGVGGWAGGWAGVWPNEQAGQGCGFLLRIIGEGAPLTVTSSHLSHDFPLIKAQQPHPCPPLLPPCPRLPCLQDNLYWLGLLTHLQAPCVPLKSLDCLRDLRDMYEAASVEDVYDAYAQV